MLFLRVKKFHKNHNRLCILITLFLIGLITEYYTASRPIRLVAEANLTGAATGIIRGLAVGMESVAIPMLLVVGAAYVADLVLGLYGIA